jgi:serine protease Do
MRMIRIGFMVVVFAVGCAQSNGANSGDSAQQNVPVRNAPNFVALARHLQPVVVNISATRAPSKPAPGERPPRQPPGAPAPRGPAPGEPGPEDELLEKFFGAPQPGGPSAPSRQQSVGSGFVIEGNGTILTNYHVVADAQKITVRLSDKREFPAKVTGSDPKTDIAVIKIDVKESLPVVRLGDSSLLEVGEWVMAVGNPFGLDSTVTSGIVSAKGRHIGAGPYDDFIQTDAPINPGNSGGPLVNERGEVVGINLAIISQTGSNIGIGFATPINLVKELLPELETKGKVTRGWVGLTIQEITPDLAEVLGMQKPRGALVAGLAKGGPAERGGIKVGDVVTEYDGQEVKTAADFPIMVARTPIQKKVDVKVLREQREVRIAMTVVEQNEQAAPDAEGKIG